MEGINLFPIFLSIRVALIATLLGVIIGVPIAYFLSRKNGKIIAFLDSLINLPIVLPPTVMGYYLLVLLGRQSNIGKLLEDRFGIMIIFTPLGAIIAATIVSIPFIIKSSKVAFSNVNEDYINSARLLGRTEIGIFFSIIVPISWKGIISGITMSFAKAIGDFGATLMVSGNIPGKTMTMPMAIYNALQEGNKALANKLVLIMTAIALLTILALNLFGEAGERNHT